MENNLYFNCKPNKKVANKQGTHKKVTNKNVTHKNFTNKNVANKKTTNKSVANKTITKKIVTLKKTEPSYCWIVEWVEKGFFVDHTKRRSFVNKMEAMAFHTRMFNDKKNLSVSLQKWFGN